MWSTYESVNQLIKRVSTKTLNMKSDQVKLFNRVNHELSFLLSKTQEIIRICLSDRNDFIIQAESLQDDYDEMTRILEQALAFKDLSSKTITNQTESSSNKTARKSNLKKLLNGSSSEEDDHPAATTYNGHTRLSETSSSSSSTSSPDKKKNYSKNKREMEVVVQAANNKSSKFSSVISIPDTCFAGGVDGLGLGATDDFVSAHHGRKSNKPPQLVRNGPMTIRDTLDTRLDEIFGKDTAPMLPPPKLAQPQPPPAPPRKDIDETCIPDSMMADNLLVTTTPATTTTSAKLIQHQQHNSQNSSTPLAVKKQLHEHGLLDLTSSSASASAANTQTGDEAATRLPSRDNSPVMRQATNEAAKVSHVDSVKSTPVKQKLSAVESPAKQSSENINNQVVSKTPIKFVLVKTPQKAAAVANITPVRSQSIITLNKKPIATDETLATAVEAEIEAETNGSKENENGAATAAAADDSMDFSFEFREAFQKSKAQQKQPQKQQQQQQPQTMVKKSQPQQQQQLHQSSNTTKKKSTQTQSNKQTTTTDGRWMTSQLGGERDSKRMKQLTMTQALASINDATVNSSMSNKSTLSTPAVTFTKTKSSNSLDKEKESSETTNKKGLHRVDVKREPIVLDDKDDDDFSRSSSSGESRKSSESKGASSAAVASATSSNEAPNKLQAEYFANYEKVPKKKSDSPKYKHLQVVRKQDERKKLGSFTCRECENYWKSVPEDQRPKHMEERCRHRAKYKPPPTPEHYWSIAFPNTQECIERGYGGVQVVADNNPNDAAAKRPRRKRPLQLFLKDKNGEGIDDDDDDDDEDNENIDPDFNQLDFGGFD